MLTAAALALVLSAAASPAEAATTTTVTVVGSQVFLSEVACSTATTCFAVGSARSGAFVLPIVKGVPAAPQVFPLGYGFSEVVCPSATTCVVYGGYKPPGTPRGYPTSPVMVVITNGVIGAPQPVPGGYTYSQVACSSATSCVGLTVIRVNGLLQQVVVVTRDGVAGPAQPIPVGVAQLTNLACASATTCYAVGQTPPDPAKVDIFGEPQPDGVVVPIVNGSVGAPMVVPGTSDIPSIACSTATTCFAVGADNDVFGRSVLVSIVNGTIGAPQALAVDVLGPIACMSATTCEAVGFMNTDTGSLAAVVPIVNGVPGAVHLVSGAGGLQAIACAAGACAAIGSVNLPPPDFTSGIVVAITEPGPASANACKNGGWKSFINPPFKNQGACVSSIKK